MAKILITGGAGFIGSQLGYSLYKEGHEVLLLDNMSYGKLDNLIIDGKTFGEFIGMDIRSKELYTVMKNVDYVFHFAGIAPLPDCQSDPYNAIDVNVAGTANVLDAARYNGVKRVIFSSTSATYENNKTFPSKEDDETSPYLIYATSKKQAELLCNSFHKTYGLDTVILRFFNVYGPHQDMKRKHPPLIGYTIRELLHNRQAILHSNGLQERDYVYVDDVIVLCKIAMTNENIVNQTVNVASNKTYSVRDIYSIIAKHLNTQTEPIYNDAKSFWSKYPKLYEGEMRLFDSVLESEVNKYALGSNEKAKSFGWFPKVSMEQGLVNCIEYAKNIFGGAK